MCDGPEKTEGARERKRRETLQRIAETGLKLFAEKGYDATTLEDVAAAADISPRTFFYYFKTKDEILKFWQGSGILDALRPTLLAEDTRQSPLDAVENSLLQLISRYEFGEVCHRRPHFQFERDAARPQAGDLLRNGANGF